MGLPIVDDRAQRGQDRRDGTALAMAQKLVDGGQIDEARAVLDELVDDPTTPIRAHACLLYAGVSLMAGDPEDAVATLGRIPEGVVVDEGYRRMIEACALRQLRRYDDALAAALASVEQGPTPGRLLVLADAQKHAGHRDDATRTLRTLLERDPANITALAQLAGYRNLDGALDEGQALFAKFRALADDGADSKRNEAFYFATRGDLHDTVTALETALALEPDATAGYIKDEVELERFTSEPAFAALRR